jgi:3-oxoacyl-[acyl-carrier protein] reductase
MTPSSKRVALVTGVGRRAGIAAAVAQALAADGWNLLLNYWRPYGDEVPLPAGEHDAAELAEELRSAGTEVALHEDDLTDPEAPARIMDTAEVLSVTSEAFDKHIHANARGTLLLTQEFARRFERNSATGHVVNFTTGLPLKDEIAYAASKAAIEAITQSSALELAHLGIRVNCIDPGPNDTGWMTPELLESVGERIPLGRAGTPADVAPLVAFLCSDAGAWITGQIIHCDGGWSTADSL